MKTLKEELAEVLSVDNQVDLSSKFAGLCQSQRRNLPLPGQNAALDASLWEASEYAALSTSDQDILSRVTGRLLSQYAEPVSKACLKLKDLLGATRQAALDTWQDMLAAMSWQQMVPAGAMRGVGGQMVSLGTMEKQLGDANIQLNLGYLVDQEHLRILLNASDHRKQALTGVELRVTEHSRGTVFSRKTNADGAVVAPNVAVEPGQYQIQIAWLDKVVETPYFTV